MWWKLLLVQLTDNQPMHVVYDDVQSTRSIDTFIDRLDVVPEIQLHADNPGATEVAMKKARRRNSMYHCISNPPNQRLGQAKYPSENSSTYGSWRPVGAGAGAIIAMLRCHPMYCTVQRRRSVRIEQYHKLAFTSI
jgi:hypothetical protein